MTFYKASVWRDEIEPIEVDGETVKFVLIRGRREVKTTEFHWFRPTFDQAKECKVRHHEKQVKIEQGRLNHELSSLEKAKALTA